MLQLKNATPFAADIAIFPNEQGIDTLYTVVKATFTLGNAWTLAEEQLPPQEGDEYWGEPETSSIKYASDFHTGKPSTDIVVIGEACAPNQKPVKRLEVQVSVGQLNKTLHVFGDRIWNEGQITEPEPFITMPIVYERAFGGQHKLDEHQCLAEGRNLVGCSFLGKRSTEEMNGMPLPNIEEPLELIQEQGDQPKPAGFGFCSPGWLPRRQYVGTCDEAWENERAPYLPVDFDSRHLNAAHPDLIYPGYLIGGEAISIKNMHPDGEIRVALPQIKMLCKINLAGKFYAPEINMESLIIEPNKKQLSMVWKAGFACDKKALKIDGIELKLAR